MFFDFNSPKGTCLGVPHLMNIFAGNCSRALIFRQDTFWLLCGVRVFILLHCEVVIDKNISTSTRSYTLALISFVAEIVSFRNINLFLCRMIIISTKGLQCWLSFTLLYLLIEGRCMFCSTCSSVIKFDEFSVFVCLLWLYLLCWLSRGEEEVHYTVHYRTIITAGAVAVCQCLAGQLPVQ